MKWSLQLKWNYSYFCLLGILFFYCDVFEDQIQIGIVSNVNVESDGNTEVNDKIIGLQTHFDAILVYTCLENKRVDVMNKLMYTAPCHSLNKSL